MRSPAEVYVAKQEVIGQIDKSRSRVTSFTGASSLLEAILFVICRQEHP